MKINESVSPSTFKNLILLIGLFMVFIVWQWVGGKLDGLRYEQVHGESFANRAVTEEFDLRELPIVVAESLNKAVDSATANELAIEAAFQASANTEIEENAAEQAVVEEKITAAQQVFLMYRPAVSAVSPYKGAVISGIYWRVGETIGSMPVPLENGETAFPTLAGVSKKQAVLMVDGGRLTLPFEQF